MSPVQDNGTEKSLGEIVSEVSEKASLLVREEIELAKAEVTSKAKTMARGAGVGAAAGVFLIFAVSMMLQTLSWLIVELLDSDIWIGFGITTLILLVFAAIAGLLAKKWLSSGPPTPDMAIEEAKITREQLEEAKP
jgi:uncharacterized membrane protein YqjE